MNKNQKTILILVTKILVGITTLISVSVRSKYIAPIDYSDYYIVIQFVGLMNVFFISWISESCARYYINDDKKQYYTTYFLSLLVSTSVSILFTFSLGLFLNITAIYTYAWYVLGFTLTSALNDVLLSMFRMTDKVKTFSFVLIFTSVSNIIIFVALPKSLGISALFITNIAIFSFVAIFSFLFLKIYSYLSFKNFSFSFLSKSLKFSIPLIIVWISSWLYNSANTFIIDFIIGSEQVSFYNMSHSITFQSLGIISGSFIFAVYPTLLMHWNSKNFGKLEKEISNSLTIIMKYLIPAIVGLCAISPFMFGTIIDNRYNPNNEGVFMMIVFAITILFDFIYQLIIRFWNLEEKTHLIAYSGIISAVLNISLTYIVLLISRNYVLVAVVYLFTIILRTFIVFKLISKRWNIKIYLSEVAFSILYSLLMGIIVYLFLSEFEKSLFYIFIGISIGVSVYFVLMLISGQLLKEIQLIKSIVDKFKKF